MSFIKGAIFAYIFMISTTWSGVSVAADSVFSQAVAVYHEVVGKDDSDATEKAVNLFNQVLEKTPKEYRALIYMGSLTARQAKLSWMPWSKLKLVNSGIDMMDKGIDAVSAQTTDPHILIEAHMVRGITSARIPKMFKRYAVATSDFKFIREHPSFAHIGTVNQATVMAFSAVLLHREGAEAEAAKFLDSARGIDKATAEKIWMER